MTNGVNAHDLISRSATSRVQLIGTERQPVVVIDDALALPAKWRALARTSDYQQIGPYYPGLRAPIARDLAEALREGMAPLIARVFAIDPVPQVLECFFSIVTTPPERLEPIQRLPHFDGLEAARIAILIFLSDANQGGTGFYRQRATGYETVDATRFATFDAALKQGVARHGLPSAAYIASDTPLYERIAHIEAQPNRALIYRSHALHCAAVPRGAELPADPDAGRLSINAFLFDPEPA